MSALEAQGVARSRTRRKARPEPMFRARVLLGAMEAARRLGHGWSEIAASHGLPSAPPLDPEAPITAAVALQSLNAAAARTGREDIGILTAVACHETLGNVIYAPLRLAMRSHPTIGGAIKFFCRNIALQNELEIHEVEEVGGFLVWKRRFRDLQVGKNRHLAACGLTASVLQLREFLGPAWKPYLTQFSSDPPNDPGAYEAFFGRVEFGADFDGVVLEEADSYYPLPTADPAALERIERFVAEHAGAVAANGIGEMEDLAVRLLLEGDCSLQRMAQEQGVDRRTVHRRLLALGVSFRDLLDRARREVIETQIGRTDRGLGEIARILGFSGLSTFSRWFHEAYGVTASDYRRRRGGATDLERQRALMDVSPVVVIGVGLSGVIHYCNPAAARLGHAPDALLGRALVALAHPDDQDRLRSLVRWDPSAVAAAWDMRLRTGSGGFLWMRATVTTLFDREGGPGERLFVLQDIDDLKTLAHKEAATPNGGI